MGLPLLAAVAGCMPNLDELRTDAASGGYIDAPGSAGFAGNAPAAHASGGSAGVPSAAGTGSLPASAGSAGSTSSASGGAPAAGSAGAVANAGAPAACVPRGAETCNGVDDDCNGVKDDGCPSAVNTVFQKDLPTAGDSPGGSVFADDCADGEVLGGLEVGIDGLLSQVRGVCRKVQLQLRSDAPGAYNVLLSSDRELLPHPETTGNTVQKLLCLENEALIEIHIAEQSASSGGQPVTIIPKIWLDCAKLTLSTQGSAYAINWEGKRDMPPLAGSQSNGTAYFADSSAPTGTVATRLRGASGSWIDRIGLGVSTLQVVVAH